MNSTVHLFCLFPCRGDQYFPRTVSFNGKEMGEGRKMKMRRFCKIAAWLSHVMISRLFKLLNQGVAAANGEVFNFE